MSELTIWQELRSLGYNEYAVAGIMGNMKAESGVESNRVEGDFSADRTASKAYTQNVDNGSITRGSFSTDAKGYGLCQWTFWSRKQGLYDYCQTFNVSISDEETQVQWLHKELKNSYQACYNILINATSVQQASDAFLLKFENPANAQAQSGTRAQMGTAFYNKYKGTSITGQAPTQTQQKPQQQGTTPTALCYPGASILKQGDKGVAVVVAQKGIQCYGINLGTSGPNRDGVDGEFGPAMANAVRLFQAKVGIPQTSLVDKTTWEKILK